MPTASAGSSGSGEALPCGIPFAELYENAPCGYHVLDREGRYLDVNRTGLAWLGCRREDVVGIARPSDFFDERDRATFARHFPRLLAGEAVSNVEVTVRGRQGRDVPVLTFATPIFDAEGHVCATRAVLQDVSVLKAQGEAQAKLIADQRAVLDAEIVGIARLRERHFVWLSGGAEHLLGYAPGELHGQPTAIIYDTSADYAQVGAAAATGQPFVQRRLRMRRKDGSPIWTSSRTVSLGNDEHLCVFVDVTAEVRAEEAARRAERLSLQNVQLHDLRRLRGRMLRDFSHELRTPLNAILGFSELLLAGAGDDPEERDEFLTHIHEAGRLLLALSDRLLLAGSEGADHWDFTPIPVEIMREVEDTVELFTQAAADKQVRVVVSGTLDGTPFRTDPLRFRQALAGYLDNAIKFSPDGARIDVSVQQQGAQLRVTVQDLGCGIPRGESARVFSHTAPRQGPETGLGLSLDFVRALVEQQGGSVTVDSTAGLGSIFELRLPSAP
jgi:PAS domain S-box-containing protein